MFHPCEAASVPAAPATDVGEAGAAGTGAAGAAGTGAAGAPGTGAAGAPGTGAAGAPGTGAAGTPGTGAARGGILNQLPPVRTGAGTRMSPLRILSSISAQVYRGLLGSLLLRSKMCLITFTSPRFIDCNLLNETIAIYENKKYHFKVKVFSILIVGNMSK